MYLYRPGASLRAHRPVKTSYREPAMASHESCRLESSILDRLRDAQPTGCTGAYAFKWSYLQESIMSKLIDPDICSDDERRNAALEKLIISELNCKGINADGYRPRSSGSDSINSICFYAQRWIADTLGDFSYELFEFTRFSSGASTSRPRRKGSSLDKYNVTNEPVDVTPKALPYALAYIKQTPLWGLDGAVRLRIVPGNRVFTVPKKSNCDRCCAAEADMNMALQLAIGRDLRTALRRRGINLNDQSINQRLALKGSIFDTLATIDLSSASDSISYRLVRDLLPFLWFNVLDDLRSPIGVLPDGSTVSWEKFSSMGNGYTFELETLIFASLLYGTVKHHFGAEIKFGESFGNHIYGDDIICHSDHAAELIQTLEQVGFATNVDKTFVSGPFRESCGKHYYNGVDVTPFYIRTPIDNTSRVIWLANSLRRWAYDERLCVCDSSVWPLYEEIKSLIPRSLRGGKDISSTLSLCTPGTIRKKLCPVVSSRRVDGIPALLRWFQSTHPRHIAYTHTVFKTSTFYTFEDLRRHDYSGIDLSEYVLSKLSINLFKTGEERSDGGSSAVSMNKVLTVKPGAFTVVVNDCQWRTIPLFSEEIGFDSDLL